MPHAAYSAVQSLAPGARVGLVAPAGPLRGPDDLSRAVDNVQSLGWEPVVGAHVLACDELHPYLAGTDAQRLEDLNRMLCDDTVDAVWCLRGGYGVMRLLDGIAYDALRLRPKPLIGYSDITALHAAVGRMCQIVTYHGPTARSVLTPFSQDSLLRALVLHHDPCGVASTARTLRGGVARGRVMGGNLALLSALVGTPYAPDLHDAILVFEDVNEPVYRIDRMLHQLWLAGLLANVRAIACGHCTAAETETIPEDEAQQTLDTVLRELADRLNVPCVAGLPIGHINDQWTLPLGAVATLDAEAGTLTFEDSIDDL